LPDTWSFECKKQGFKTVYRRGIHRVVGLLPNIVTQALGTIPRAAIAVLGSIRIVEE